MEYKCKNTTYIPLTFVKIAYFDNSDRIFCSLIFNIPSLETCRANKNSLTDSFGESTANKTSFSDIEKKVLRKYSFLSPKICKYPIGKKMDYYTQIPWQALDDIYVANECEIASLCRFLMLESIDMTWFEIRDEILQKRQRALDVRFSNMQPININDVKYRKLNALKLAELRERI